MARQSKIVARKQPTATGLTSKQLALLDREVKERSLFSARTTEQRYVAEMQDVLEEASDGRINLAEARKRLMAILDDFGYTPEAGFPDADKVDPANPGTITDLSSYGRINLIVETNEGMAASVSRLAEENDDTLDMFPAWRLTRFMQPNGQPRDWQLRWEAAGRSVRWAGACRDEMVARKDSPIWQALGDGAGGFTDTLHNAYPPFAFNSGMGWEDVDRDEAESLGLDVSGPVKLQRPTLAVSETEIEQAREHYGDSFVDSLNADIELPNEQCEVDGTFLDEHGQCNSKKHGAASASAAEPKPVGSHADDAQYKSYRDSMAINPAMASRADTALASFKDPTTGRRRYASLDDLFQQAQSVSDGRLADIERGYNSTCAIHEAVAFLTARPKVKDIRGEEVQFVKGLVNHYLFGERRADNTPKPDSLMELPRAVYAIKNRVPFVKVSSSGARQFQYSMAHPKMNTYVYCDSGVVSGWHILKH